MSIHLGGRGPGHLSRVSLNAISLLLPVAAGTPVVLYSVVKSSGWTGKCLRVARSSDATETDIGFGANGVVDMGAALVFAAGSNLTVTKWYDQSGNGNDAVQATTVNQPVLSTKNLWSGIQPITFNPRNYNTPVNVFMSLPVGVSIGRTSISAFAAMAPEVSLQRNMIYEVGSSASNEFNLFTRGDTGSAVAGLAWFNGAVIVPSTPTLIPRCQPSVLGVVSSPTNFTFYRDSTVLPTAATSNVTVTGGTIGDVLSGAPYLTRGDYMAFVLYNTALSGVNATAVQTAFDATFSTNPKGTRQVLWDGDSITEGFGSSLARGYPRECLSNLTFPVQAFNMGVASQLLSNMNTRYSARVAPQFLAGQTSNVLMIAGGTNDIVAGTTGAATYALMQSYVAAAKATGWKVVVATILPRTDFTGAMQTQQAAFNTLIRGDFAGANALADFQSEPTMGVQANVGNTTYFADGVHPTDTGYGLIAPYAYNAINSIL